MLYEFIATIAAGFGLAGVALIITHLSKLAGKKAPKWLIPLFAAIGIFGFQVQQEYYWFEQQVTKLPKGVTVVNKVEESTWFRPWTYVKPQTLRFIAADGGNARANEDNKDFYLVNLYLFEKRRNVQKVQQVINCANPARADYALEEKGSKLTIDEHVKQTTAWRPLSKEDPLYINVCLNRA